MGFDELNEFRHDDGIDVTVVTVFQIVFQTINLSRSLRLLNPRK